MSVRLRETISNHHRFQEQRPHISLRDGERSFVIGSVIGDKMSYYYCIPLTQSKFAKIDREDYWAISKHKWYALNGHSHRLWYAVRHNPRKPSQLIFMHREILNLPKGTMTDHINRDGLDNRGCNLRQATDSLNAHNRRIQVNNTSGIAGVSWDKKAQKWRAQIKINKVICLGCFQDRTEAEKAYQEIKSKLLSRGE